MLLSVDWDAFSGTRELVFDAPIWGTRDRDHDRLEAWRGRVRQRQGDSWDALAHDFPLYSGWQALRQYAGVPAWVALSHADAWAWLDFFPPQPVLNVDSHHDLGSLSGDPARVRPGNWAGLALQAGKISNYACHYPDWHAHLPVAEGYDLARTRTELEGLLPADVLGRVTLARPPSWPHPQEVAGLLLVQSPAWTNPAHDAAFYELVTALRAHVLTAPLNRVNAHSERRL
ncbi:arginase [Deinococcus fonticola]|uniref:arginase n=1 Tax=Deinococcus fonticola TaxID=2528713 RepID=UPI001074B362|nr:arginase [Deinococcus fonticola]